MRRDQLWRDRLAIAAVHTLSWAPLLVNRGLYWDDWSLVGRSLESIVQGAGELGMPWLGAGFALLFALPMPGLVGHALVFCAYLLSALLLHAVLRRTPGMGRRDALVAAMVFAVLPVNYARVALVDLTYALSLLAFLAATWLLVRHVEVRGRRRRLASLALYACSFSTASLLVMYALPVALAAYVAWRSRTVAPPSFVARYADFVALPIVFWLVKSAVFTPSGAYEGYNALTRRGIAGVPEAMLAIPSQVLVEPVYRAVAVAGVLGVVVGGGVAAWLWRRSRQAEPGPLIPAPVLAIAGFVALGLGVFAYLAVGLEPTIWDWASRHQLLVPIGAGLIVAAVMRGSQAGRAGPVVCVAVGLLIGISAVANARTLVMYQVDWFKQVALVEAARSMPAMQGARHIRVVDTATQFNALDRRYRFYEYNALFEAALGDQRRLASDATHEPGPADIGRFISRPAYRMGGYVPSPVDLELRVSAARGFPGELEVLRLVVLEALGSPSFLPEVSGLIEVRTAPVP